MAAPGLGADATWQLPSAPFGLSDMVLFEYRFVLLALALTVFTLGYYALYALVREVWGRDAANTVLARHSVYLAVLAALLYFDAPYLAVALSFVAFVFMARALFMTSAVQTLLATLRSHDTRTANSVLAVLVAFTCLQGASFFANGSLMTGYLLSVVLRTGY